MDNISDDYYFTFKYSFSSETGLMRGYRYARDFRIRIYARTDETREIWLAGKVVFKIVYVQNAITAGYDLYEIFDSYEITSQYGSQIFDFEEMIIKEDIGACVDGMLMEDNICFLENIEILPRFRGYSLAAKLTKDIIFHFGAACSLFVIDPCPMQFETKGQKLDEWQSRLGLNTFSTDEKIAFEKLRNYFKSFGFFEIEGYDHLLFYTPIKLNDQMDYIDLDE